ncbi:MAG: hypothetical protein LBU34_03990 [Planctomycetaceae bacterium]|jgi:hypothetical protein|nr:hypothetical protein [Planctomycetaceae bacterium]
MLHNTVIKYVVIFHIFLLLFFGQNRLFAANYGKISIQEIPMTSDAGTPTSYGYLEYRFRVTNKDTKAHTVGLEIPKTNFVRGQTELRRSANSITVPPQSTAILRLLQPPFPMHGDEAQVIIDGRYQRDSTPFRRIANHGDSYYPHEIANILSSNEVPGDLRNLFQSGIPPEKVKTPESETENSENKPETPEGETENSENKPETPESETKTSESKPETPEGETKTSESKQETPEGETETSENKPETPESKTVPATVTHGSSGTITSELMPWTSNIPVEEWSDYWLAYTRFDAVILTGSEWNEIQERHAGVFDALKKYTEAGGILGVVGTDVKIPKEWLPAEDSAQNPIQKYQAVLGLVYVFDKNTDTIKPVIEPFRETVLKQAKLWRSTSTGGYNRSSSSLSAVLSSETALLSSLPVVANYGINIKLIMILIVVFAALIAPVNIYILSLVKRRIWLLWTVPLTSLVASVLVLGVSFFQEGFLRQSSSATYTIFDQQREEAVTFGFVGFYSTLTPRGIVFAPETEATACLERGYGNAKSLEIYLTAGGNQFLAHGWISARIPSYFVVRKAQSQRKERITFDWTTGSPSATNGLGMDIKELHVCSPAGELFTAQNIKAGEKVPLTVSVSTETIVLSATLSKAAAFNELRQAYATIIPNGSATFPIFSSNRLPAGSYLVETDVWNPFVEEGIDRTTPYQNKTIIFGLFE